MKDKINVLGSIYDIQFLDEPNEIMTNGNYAALCNYNEKIIQVCKVYHGGAETEFGEIKSEESIRQDLLHELAHAFLHESGQDDINDERTVEVMAKFCKFIESQTLNTEQKSLKESFEIVKKSVDAGDWPKDWAYNYLIRLVLEGVPIETSCRNTEKG